MTHRFYLKQDLSSDIITVTSAAFCHQIARVLKLKPGENIVLFNGNGQEVFVLLVDVKSKQIQAKVTERQAAKNEPLLKTTLFVATIKRDNFEWVVQKATEVGVDSIMPMMTERTVKLGLNRTRLETIIKEAAEQSQRVIVPALGDSINFANALLETKKFDEAILFDKTGPLLSEISFKNKPKTIAVLIGPEGGFSRAEVESAKKIGVYIASLGNLTLRAETAAVVASYLASNL